MSPRRPAPRVAGVLVAAAALLAGCSGDASEPIETAVVELGDVQEVVEAPANVAARASAVLVAPASGRVEDLRVADGKPIKSGNVLLSIDSPQAQAQLRQARQADAQAAASGAVTLPGLPVSESAARADRRAAAAFDAARDAARDIPDDAARAEALAALARAEADYAAARADAERAVRRFNAGLGSLAEAVATLGQAQRVQTQAAVELAERTVDSLVVESPIAGVVSLGVAGSAGASGPALPGLPESLSDAASALGGAAAAGGSGGEVLATISEGSAVTSGQTLATVTDVSELSLVAEVDETDVLLVSPGTPAVVELDALPGTSYDATVTSVDVAPTASARGGVAYRVRMALGEGTDPEGEVAPRPRPGMSAVANLTVRDVVDQPVVPTSAVVRSGGRDAVWLARDGVARQRFVQVGAQGESTVQIVSGLQVGDEIVVRGADRVSDGQRLDDGG